MRTLRSNSYFRYTLLGIPLVIAACGGLSDAFEDLKTECGHRYEPAHCKGKGGETNGGSAGARNPDAPTTSSGGAFTATGGSAGAPPDGGSAGAPPNDDHAGTGGAGSGGTAGEPNDGEDPVIAPECVLNGRDGTSPVVELGRARSIGVNSGTNHFGVYASRVGKHTLLSQTGMPGTWSSWRCLDAIPDPDRVVGLNLPSNRVELFVTTTTGKLWVRRLFLLGWGQWLPFSLPSVDSWVQDLGGSTNLEQHTHIYIVDRSQVFMRYRLGDNETAGYGRWTSLGSVGGTRVAAGLDNQGLQRVYATDAAGALWEKVQTKPDLGAAFGDWQRFDTEEVGALADVECGPTNSGGLVLYGIDTAGDLWTRGGVEDKVSASKWQKWETPALPDKVATAASVRLRGNGFGVLLAIVTRSGAVQYTIQNDGKWSDWASFP